MLDAIADVAGIRVGHYTDVQHGTGCTVVLCGTGAVGGVAVRGAAPGTRETDLLRPMHLVQQVHAVLLSGGSAFGLEAAGGVMRYLEERSIGFQTPAGAVPIVPAAVLFDLGLITGRVRPTAQDAYQACLAATGGPVAQGSVGAGTGATVGKTLGLEHAIKGGVGTASVQVGNGPMVGALVVVNAVGDVVDPETGDLLAGPRRAEGRGFHSTVELWTRGAPSPSSPFLANTTIGVVATDARLTKEQANWLACLAHDGLALAVRPCHTTRDGDCLFALATGAREAPAELDHLGAAAVAVVARAVVSAIANATGLGGVPSAREWRNGSA
ncbi:MAG: P1 family peptidase [Chloroflexi bacterium]|nr:P1 family peptidase [Chloroflexota bacterium]